MVKIKGRGKKKKKRQTEKKRKWEKKSNEREKGRSRASNGLKGGRTDERKWKLWPRNSGNVNGARLYVPEL